MEFRNLTHAKISKSMCSKNVIEHLILSTFTNFLNILRRTINLLMARSSKYVYLLSLHADYHRNIITSEIIAKKYGKLVRIKSCIAFFEWHGIFLSTVNPQIAFVAIYWDRNKVQYKSWNANCVQSSILMQKL